MSKSMFRVYWRIPAKTLFSDGKWKLIATFVWKSDAISYVDNKYDPKSTTHEYKIMHNNRNVKVYKSGI